MKHRLGSQRGQTAVEYTAVLLIVALVIAAITASGIASTIAEAVEREIACVSQQSSDCGDESGGSSARSADPAGSDPRLGLVDARRVSAPMTYGVAARSASVRGAFGDALDAFLDLLEGGSPVTEIDGYLVPIELNGLPLPVGAIRKLFGLTSAAYDRAAKFAKRLGIRPEILLASQKASANLVDDLAKALPEATRRRITLAVGVGKDSKGRLKLIVGTSEPNGYMRPAVRALLEKRKIEVAKGPPGQTLSGHAERQVLEHMRRRGLQPVTVGASRPICRVCADAIRRAGATFATKVKPPPRPRPTRPG